jgi:hypothetical protein
MAASVAQPILSRSSHQPSSAVNAADEYTSTVATAAPFAATESTHSPLNTASTRPCPAR